MNKNCVHIYRIPQSLIFLLQFFYPWHQDPPPTHTHIHTHTPFCHANIYIVCKAQQPLASSAYSDDCYLDRSLNFVLQLMWLSFHYVRYRAHNHTCNSKIEAGCFQSVQQYRQQITCPIIIRYRQTWSKARNPVYAVLPGTQLHICTLIVIVLMVRRKSGILCIEYMCINYVIISGSLLVQNFILVAYDIFFIINITLLFLC